MERVEHNIIDCLLPTRTPILAYETKLIYHLGYDSLNIGARRTLFCSKNFQYEIKKYTNTYACKITLLVEILILLKISCPGAIIVVNASSKWYSSSISLLLHIFIFGWRCQDASSTSHLWEQTQRIVKALQESSLMGLVRWDWMCYRILPCTGG